MASGKKQPTKQPEVADYRHEEERLDVISQ